MFKELEYFSLVFKKNIQRIGFIQLYAYFIPHYETLAERAIQYDYMGVKKETSYESMLTSEDPLRSSLSRLKLKQQTN